MRGYRTNTRPQHATAQAMPQITRRRLGRDNGFGELRVKRRVVQTARDARGGAVNRDREVACHFRG